MTHGTDIAFAALCAAVAALTGVMIVPRPKPEPPPVVCDFKDANCKPVGQVKPVVVIRPKTEKTDAERVDDLAKQVKELSTTQEALKDDIKAVLEEKRKKQQP